MNKLSNYKFAYVTAFSGNVTRTERIDLRNNTLFFGCRNTADIEKVYETFWGGRVKVISITLIN